MLIPPINAINGIIFLISTNMLTKHRIILQQKRAFSGGGGILHFYQQNVTFINFL